MASGTGNKLTLKLLIDKKNNVVLFAEAEKEVVDFIFHLLALPIGTAVELISKDAMVGALGNLYDSVETLNATYLQCSNKDVLLKPKIPSYGGGSSETLLLPAANSSAKSTATTYYKDVVNFIFHLLALPMGTVIRLLTKSTMVGFLGKLYESIETLNDTYMQSYDNKEIPLKPETPSYGGGSSEALLLPAANSTATYYRCTSNNSSHCTNYVTLVDGQACPSCRYSMSGSLTLVGAPSAAAAGTVAPSASGGGYVKGVVTYMVMDDLVVKPMSTISSITLLNKFNVMDLTALEEKIVDFGFAEGVKLLKASLESTNVLTNVFLGGKKTAAH